jgi:hypothetical protein
MKIKVEPSTPPSRCQAKNAIKMMALFVILVYFHVILGCGPSSCPSKEVAEYIAKQLIFKEYSSDQYNIDLKVKRKFMKKIKDEEYCVYEFNYNATLKEYFLRYEELEKQSYKKGMQVAYTYKNGWYGTIIQRPQ